MGKSSRNQTRKGVWHKKNPNRKWWSMWRIWRRKNLKHQSVIKDKRAPDER